MEKNKLLSLPEYGFELLENEFLGICGPTGCGKTTLLNKIYEALQSEMDISYAFQEPRLIESVSVEKNLKLVNKEPEAWINTLELTDIRNRKAGVLSGGEAQRVNLARAFCWDGQLYLLDEPFSAQDEKHKQLILDLIAKRHSLGRTVVMVSHDKEVLNQYCDRVIELVEKNVIIL